MSRLKKLIQQFGLLSRIDQAFLISLVVRVGYPLVGSVYQLPGEGFVRLIFVITSILFLIRSFPKLVRKVLWRVRHRLLATWLLVGVVPIVLICALLWEGLFILMGQVVGYMTTNEITRQSESVRSTAYGLAWSLAHRESSATIPTLTETF